MVDHLHLTLINFGSELILTRIIAHPVGAKARIAANTSLTVSPHTKNKIVVTVTKPKNKSTLTILNMS